MIYQHKMDKQDLIEITGVVKNGHDVVIAYQGADGQCFDPQTFEAMYEPVSDPVKPNHYATEGGHDLYYVLATELLTREEFIGSIKKDVYKYVFRCENKNGIEDLKKAKQTIDVLIDYLEGKYD